MSKLGSLRGWFMSRINDYLCGRGEGEDPLPFHHVLDIELSVIDRKRRPMGGDGTDLDSAIQMASGEIDLSNVLSRRGETTEDPHATAAERRRREHAAVKRALDRDLIGLSFSGGGIRSATFNLGVIQALADLRLLPAIDYLSTVSGGGYIGSWLSALTERENRKPPTPGEPHGIDAVQQRLMTRRSADQPVEDAAVGFLRQYSNYLSPRLGLLSADTWAIVATYLRNLVLNLLVVLPGLTLFLFIPWLVFAASGLLGELLDKDTCNWIFFCFSLLGGMVATVVMGYNMAALVGPGMRGPGDDAGEDARALRLLRPGTLLTLMILPLTLAAYLASRWMPGRADADISVWVLGVAGTYGVSWAIAAGVASVSRWRSRQTARLWGWLVATATACGAVAGALLWLLAQRFDAWSKASPSFEPTLAVWGPPLVLVWFILLGVLQTGIMGRRMLDSQREWLSRLGAWLLIFALGWTVLFATVVHGPAVIAALAGWGKAMLAGGWLAATLGGLLATRTAGADPGRLRGLVASVAPYVFIAGLILLLALGLSAGLAVVTSNDAEWRALGKERRGWVAKHQQLENLRTRAAAGDAPAAIDALKLESEVELGALLARLLDYHNALIIDIAVRDPNATFDIDRQLVVATFVLLLAGTWLLAWRIDVNEFSMHSLYRNRLVRAYLGASVDAVERRRRVQPFTGFYRNDDLPLAGTDQPARDRDAIDLSKRGPLHLINVALNLVGGDQLAWQERKAASFLLSPLFCGFEPPDEDDFNAALKPSIKRHGFRPAKSFASLPRRQRLTLGGAMAISGAAASPNMGFRSTAASAFLLTVFNVRLGWWLGNPRHARTWRRSGPMIALLHLLQEISGSARGRTRYVYASDGGHFENVGIYELVRRRCRFIIACDAGADADLAFDDLGGAIRKCRADFGVDIDLDLGPIREGAEGAVGDGTSRWHCALGTVRYLREGEEGAILYVKASVTGDEPADVLNYRRQNPTFPHQSTGDQFFDESQFESYRRLGHHVMTQVLEDAAMRASEPPGQVLSDDFAWKRTQLARLWRGLAERWLSPSRAARAGFTRLTKTLDGLLERLRTDDRLRFLDAQFYPEWHRLLEGACEDVPADTLWLPDSAEERSQGFYFCGALIQLMENVYIDLALDESWDDPDNRGWTNLFRHWSWSGMLRATWAITAATYGQRFQTFCADHLGLNLGQVALRPLAVDAGSGPSRALTAETFAAALDREGRTFLNFYEREQIGIYLACAAKADRQQAEEGAVPDAHRVLQLEVVVPGAAGVDRSQAELLRFGFGYAVVGGDNQLVLFRVQDHLRRMGLGARALRELIAGLHLRVRASRKHALVFAEVVEAIAAIPTTADSPQRRARTRFAEEFRGGGEQLAVLLRSAAREIRDNGPGMRPSST